MTLLLPLLFALLSSSAVAHDFHVSRLTVNVDHRDQRVKLTLQTFVDDLEKAMAKEHSLPKDAIADARGMTQASLNLLSPKQHPLADSLVEAYVRRRIQLTEGTRLLPGLRYLGMEAADDPYAMYLYLSAPLPSGKTQITVHSRFFIDLYGDQQNVIVWQRNGEGVDYDLLTGQKLECTFGS